MAAVDIVRDRERGLPRYNQARRQYGLKPVKSFSDITDNPLVRGASHSLHHPCQLPYHHPVRYKLGKAPYGDAPPFSLDRAACENCMHGVLLDQSK